MKTRFSPLVKLKKDTMGKCERDLQQANHARQDAQKALSNAYEELRLAATPDAGSMTQFLQARMLISAQREVITQKQAWFDFAVSQVETAKEAMKQAMVEYEKFKYLEAEQIKAVVKKEKLRQQRDLDEIAGRAFIANKER